MTTSAHRRIDCLSTCGMQRAIGLLCIFMAWTCAAQAADDLRESQWIEPRFVHVRSGPTREWVEFPEAAEAAQLDVRFKSTRNETEWSLRLRQQDVKQGWNVLLNGKRLGELVRDENDMALWFAIPPDTTKEGENILRVEGQSGNAATSDDIRVGLVRLEQRSKDAVLNEGSVEVRVVEDAKNEPLPCRLTIVDGDGVLQSVGATSNDQLAVRAGTIFTARGEACFGLPAGNYTIYAGRGFEYSLARAEITVAAGKTVQQLLKIKREVPTDGYVACDTHIHTLTHSGHGDATITERMITVAAEGIEFPIATDHNKHIDYEPLSRQLNLRKHFTPVIGNEVTTSLGHFNIFPVAADARVPDHRKKDWESIFAEIFQTNGARIVILNHARDLHSGVRPFGPKWFNAAAGENLHGWPMRFTAMEVVNSGATQTDQLQLFRDWMAVLNRGYFVTPVGSSDSHDVARHFVGQGRTYIRSDDRDPGNLDVSDTVASFLQGRVMVSYGLLAELTVADRFRSGDLVPISKSAQDGSVSIDLRVLGPHWTKADRIRLYSNGTLLREERLPDERDPSLPGGVHWQGKWKLPRPRHDVHLVAIATGPGIAGSFWKTAKPYQPTSPEWVPQVLGCSGALWIDADGDGQRSTARNYAERLFAESKGDLAQLGPKLEPYDSATAIQAAHLYRGAGGSLNSDEFNDVLQTMPPAAQAGFRSYVAAWRDNELAQAQP